MTAEGTGRPGRLGRRRDALLGPAVAPGGTSLLAICLVDSTGTGMYLAGSVLFFTIIIGLSAAQVGIGLSVAGLLGLSVQPVIGWLADRWGPRRLLILLNLYRAAGFTAYVFVDKFTGFLIVAAYLGVGEGAGSSIYQALAEQIVGPEKRVAMMARIRVAFNVGFTVGALLASVAIGVGTKLAFDTIFLGNAASFVVAAALLARTRMRHPAAAAEKTARSAPLRLLALRDGRYMAVAGVNGLLVLHIALLGIGVPLWVSQHTSAPRALVGLLLVVNTVLAVLFQVRVARGTESVAGSVSAMRKGAVALVAACVLFALAPKPGSSVPVTAILVAGLVALTAGELFQSAGGWGLSYALAPNRSRAEYLATFNLGTSAQFVLGPTIVTVGVVGHGTDGWLVLAGCFLAAGVAVGPLAARAVTCDNTDTQPLMAQTTVPAQPAPARSVPEPAAGLPAAAAAPERSVRRPMAEPSARVRSWPDIDVRQLRHPSERSRFAFSASVSLLLVGLGLLLTLRLGGIRWLVGLTALVPVALGSLWCLVQAYRAHLLGGAARVTPETFPELSAAASKLKRQLGHMPVEMFVTANARDPVLLTSFLGTHVLVMNGDLVAELVKPGNRPQLDFILATFFGKLEVKALAWAPARVAIDALRLPRVLNVLIAPWERATVYSGDQVAAACCGSLDESVIALNRLLVGKDLAPSVGMTGLMGQAVSVRQRWLPWLQEICSSSPHMTSRYLNLLSFAGQTAPEQARAFRESLKHRTGLKVRDVLARSARLRSRRRRRGLLPVSLGASIVLLGVAALGMFPSVPQHLVAALQKAQRTPSAAAATPRVAAAASSAAPSVSPAFPDTPSDAVAGLESHVPPAFAGTCTPVPPQPAMTGLVAAIACTPSGSGAPARVQYYQFANATGMNTAFNHAVSGVTESGTCDQGGQRGKYHFAGGPVSGMWACSCTAGTTGQLIWTSTNLGIMGLANDPSQTPRQLSNWFFSPAATGPE